MAQSRKMSLAESAVNTFGGFGVALYAQIHIFPWFDIHISTAESAGIALIMLVISLARQYLFRRFFVWLESRAKTPEDWDSSPCKPLENNEQIVRLGQC